MHYTSVELQKHIYNYIVNWNYIVPSFDNLHKVYHKDIFEDLDQIQFENITQDLRNRRYHEEYEAEEKKKAEREAEELLHPTVKIPKRDCYMIHVKLSKSQNNNTRSNSYFQITKNQLHFASNEQRAMWGCMIFTDKAGFESCLAMVKREPNNIKMRINNVSGNNINIVEDPRKTINSNHLSSSR